MKKFAFITAFCMLALQSVYAMNVRYGEDVTISEAVYEDLYVAGGTVTVNAPVYGDLVVAGGTVIVNDSIQHDIIVGGGEVKLNGYAGDDVRCAGGRVYISGYVTDDLLIGGGEATLDRAGYIGGDILAGAGTLVLNGNVQGNVKAGSGAVELNGDIGGDVDSRGGEIKVNGTVAGNAILAASTIQVGSNALFKGNITYWNNDKNLKLNDGQVMGAATYDPALEIEEGKWQYMGYASIVALLWYLVVVFLFILLIQYLFSYTMKLAADKAYIATWKSLGIGFLFFAAMPLAVLILFITVIGIPIGIFALLGYISLILLATVLSSVVIANWFNNRYNKDWSFIVLSLIALIMFVVLKALSMIPVLGWLIMLVIAFIVFGALIQAIRWRRKRPVIA